MGHGGHGPTRTHTHGEGIMAGKRTPRPSDEMRAVTADRVARLFQLVSILAGKPVPRQTLLKRFRMNQRSFYRDIEFLRSIGIGVVAADTKYRLSIEFNEALARLPFPDPVLTLGQAIVLAKGKSAAHKVMQKRVKAITK
jgi:predicted DNA-binding transcriptional regulator YafY